MHGIRAIPLHQPDHGRVVLHLTRPVCAGAQPFEFTAGEVVSGVSVKKISDSANGLFAGSGGPRPPPALGTAVLGMRSGGKVCSRPCASPSPVHLSTLLVLL